MVLCLVVLTDLKRKVLLQNGICHMMNVKANDSYFREMKDALGGFKLSILGL